MLEKVRSYVLQGPVASVRLTWKKQSTCTVPTAFLAKAKWPSKVEPVKTNIGRTGKKESTKRWRKVVEGGAVIYSSHYQVSPTCVSEVSPTRAVYLAELEKLCQ